ncbi:MAG: hypothetical protein K940chlam3_01010 [Chlamydiae bacterium]|nr:hypothetical protein [Chlamydiota bacterium]
MESTSAITHDRALSVTTVEPRDIETGYSHYLSVNEVKTTLGNRKVDLIVNPWSRIGDIACGSSACGFAVGVVATFLHFTAFGIYCLVKTKDENCIALNVVGAPFFVGIGLCIAVFGFGVAMGLGQGQMNLRENRRRGLLNQDLEDHRKRLSYYADTDNPVRADDIIEFISEELISDSEIKQLSFQQLREVKNLELEVFKWLEKEQKLGMEQYAPWRKIELLRNRALGDLTDAFNEGYISSLIHSTPGFFEELLKIVPKNILENAEATSALIQNLRSYLSRHFEGDFTEEEIRDQILILLNGGMIENCFRMIDSDEAKLTLICGTRNVEIPYTLLKEYSDYFVALFDFHKSLSKYEFQNLTEEQFDVFIQSIRGKKMTINQKNVEEYLEIASFFQSANLARDCELPLTLKYSRQSLEERMKLLEMYPIITGSFVDYVDRDFIEQLVFENILDEADEYKRCFHLTEELGLIQAQGYLEQLLENEVDDWSAFCSPKEDFKSFAVCINNYYSLLPKIDSFRNQLIDVIKMRLKHERDLSIIYNMILECPSTLFITAMCHYLEDEKNRNHAEASFVSVVKTKTILLDELDKLWNDETLLTSIEEWKKTSLYIGKITEFLDQICVFDCRKTDKNEYSPLIVDELIEAIHMRIATNYKFSGGSSTELEEYYEQIVWGDNPPRILFDGLLTFLEDKKNAKQVQKTFRSPKESLAKLLNRS